MTGPWEAEVRRVLNDGVVRNLCNAGRSRMFELSHPAPPLISVALPRPDQTVPSHHFLGQRRLRYGRSEFLSKSLHERGSLL